MTARSFSFPPVIPPRPRVLILGTLPGAASLAAQEYYAHPRNAFWPILAALSACPPPQGYAAKLALLHANGIALWDVLHSARRPGSLDAAIREATPNAIAHLLRDEPGIASVLFNGRGAEHLFRRHIAKDVARLRADLTSQTLPSTSPAFTLPFDAKLIAWRAALAGKQP